MMTAASMLFASGGVLNGSMALHDELCSSATVSFVICSPDPRIVRHRSAFASSVCVVQHPFVANSTLCFPCQGSPHWSIADRPATPTRWWTTSEPSCSVCPYLVRDLCTLDITGTRLALARAGVVSFLYSAVAPSSYALWCWFSPRYPFLLSPEAALSRQHQIGAPSPPYPDRPAG